MGPDFLQILISDKHRPNRFGENLNICEGSLQVAGQLHTEPSSRGGKSVHTYLSAVRQYSDIWFSVFDFTRLDDTSLELLVLVCISTPAGFRRHVLAPTEFNPPGEHSPVVPRKQPGIPMPEHRFIPISTSFGLPFLLARTFIAVWTRIQESFYTMLRGRAFSRTSWNRSTEPGLMLALTVHTPCRLPSWPGAL